MKANKNIYWVDLFSGAGGTSTGIHLAGQKVVACVNHDADAIAAHQANHPDTIHLTEDIRDFNVVRKLKQIVAEIRRTDPLALIAVWASLECTNFSKAKGGLPRDADSRTLAEHGDVSWMVYEDDCETMIKIKEFMTAYSITDIKMRMLNVSELLRIQGFPDGYVLKGNQTEQKKQVGNAVEVYQSTAIAKAFYESVQLHFECVAA